MTEPLDEAALAQIIDRLRPSLIKVARNTAKQITKAPAVVLRPGTVETYDPATGDAEVLIDGDDDPSPTQVLGYAPSTGERVMVLFVPPHGVFVIGHVGGAPNGGGIDGLPGPPGPSVGRLAIEAHSYGWDDLNTPYGGTNPQDGDETRDGATFAQLLRDAVVGNAMSTRYLVIDVPAAGTTEDVVASRALPEDAVVEGVYYVPNGALPGAATNTRRHEAQTVGILGFTTFAQRQYDAGISLADGIPQAIYAGMGSGADLSTRSKGPTGSLFPFTPWQASIVYPAAGTRPNVFRWKSTHVGTGLADPGGSVIVRLGGRYRNGSQGGALAMMGGVYMGGYGAKFASHRGPQAFGVEVNVVGAGAAGAATSIPVEALAAPIPLGWKVEFSNGITATVNAAAAPLDTAITVTALAGAVPAGKQGFAKPTTDAVDSYLAEAIVIFMLGINDSAWWSPQPRSGWREVIRSLIALRSCPYATPTSRANFVYTGAGWELFTQPAGGQWATQGPYGLAAANMRFTGAGSGSVTIETAPDYPGGFLDFFFMALAGTGRGAQATISVDGGTAKIIDTSGASTAGADAITGTTLTGVTFLVGTGYNQTMIGKTIEHPGVPKGTISGFVNDAGTAMTLTNPATGAAVGASSDQTSQPGTVVGYCPMVKRVAAAAGAHTTVMTITGIDATDKTAALLFERVGFETPSAIFWSNVAQLPNGFAASNIADQNTDAAAVLAGTATPVGTSTIEPDFDAELVTLFDLDAILGADVAKFLADNLHPNGLGHRDIAIGLINAIRALTIEQALTR